jgi:hypothetical protein
VERFTSEHTAQRLNYLRDSGLTVCLLVISRCLKPNGSGLSIGSRFPATGLAHPRVQGSFLPMERSSIWIGFASPRPPLSAMSSGRRSYGGVAPVRR